jgi:uncharacterized protein YdiU (UPF0061 family)
MTPDPAGWNLQHSYAQLPKMFYQAVEPVPVVAPRLVVVNHALAATLGLTLSEDDALAECLSGNKLLPDSQPLAMAYAGHQFGHFNKLGDGRAHLLGEQNGFDIQLKGSGQTPYSRRGDGRAALAPMLREYIMSEAMFALGIPTTRSLAVVSTGEPVMRETLLEGAILTRVAASHLCVGTFEYAASFGNKEELTALVKYAILRHYPERAAAKNPAFALLDAVVERQAALIAKWMLIGFIHGVMNTDNMSIAGETIDYGPCAMMDAYHPQTVFSSIDHQGRYAYANQPPIAQWNLARLAESLLPLLDAEPSKANTLAQEALGKFHTLFSQHWLAGMRAKLGLFGEEVEDLALIESLLEWMQQHQADYTNTFRHLDPEAAHSADADFVAGHRRWQARLARNTKPLKSSRCLMQASNPAIIPRNHRVEEALVVATERHDFSVMHRLLAALAKPFAEVVEYAEYSEPPAPSSLPYYTFCGT